MKIDRKKLPLSSRLTKQRQAVLDVFSQPGLHLSARQVYEIILKKIPRVTYATVYRNIKFLEINDYLKPLDFTDNPVLYEQFVEKHSHMICRRCQNIYNISQPVKKCQPRKTKEGHAIESCSLVYKGVCTKCLKTKKYVKK